MKTNTLKTRLSNKAKILVSALILLVFILIFSLLFKPVFRIVIMIMIYLPLAFAFLLLLLPFVLTILFNRLVRIINKDQSTVDYLTYVNQGMLNEFNWDEDPASHVIGDIERRRVAMKDDSEDYARGILPQARFTAPTYSLDDIADIPDYDPNGPSPFKKT